MYHKQRMKTEMEPANLSLFEKWPFSRIITAFKCAIAEISDVMIVVFLSILF